MIKINVEDKIKPTEDYKLGDMLMTFNGYSLDKNCIYMVESIILDDLTTKYMLLSITEHYQTSVEESFDSLEEMISYYHEHNACFVKVDVSINVRLNN